MSDSNRIASIDSFRGLLIVLMLFINDFYPQVAQQMSETGVSGITGFNAGGWLLPVFLFIAGLSIPYSIGKRLSDGQDTKTIARHIIIRSVSLMIIGLIMVNSERVNAEFTGMGKNLWALLMYSGVFLVWNNYKHNDNNFFTIAGLRLAGISILIALVYKFQSGQFENNGSLITGWWGYTGIIAWGYLVSALIYLLTRDNLMNMIYVALAFFVLVILGSIDTITIFDPLKPIFGVVTGGYVPFIIMSGIITTLLLKKYEHLEPMRKIQLIVLPGLFLLLTGFILNKFLLRSFDDQDTSAWVLIRTGINMMLFVIFYWIIEINDKKNWTKIIGIIGENALTAYLLSITLYHLILASGLPLLFYKQSDSLIITTAGSLIWTVLVIFLTKFLVKKEISLRL